MLRRLPIRTKLALVSILILFPMTLITGLGARRQWLESREAVFTNRQEMAEAIARALDAFLQNFADTQAAIGVAAQRGIGSPRALKARMRDVTGTSSSLLGYAVSTPDGTPTNSDPPPDWWRGLRDRSDVAAVQSGRPWGVSNLQQTVNGVSVVTLATPLPGTDRLVRSAIDVRALNELLHVTLRPGWRVLILDGAGRLVYHSLAPDPDWEQRDWSQSPGVREALTRGQSRPERHRSQVDGQWCLGSYTRDRATGWIVGSACPMELAMAPARAGLLIDCYQIALAIAVSLVLILLLGAWISRPIEQLAAAVAVLGRGETVAFVPEERQDELGVLGQAFNRMAAQVQERFEREHTIASTLQKAFLPQRLPDCPGYTFGAAYHPALQEAEVGGDFYDVFRLPDGCMGLLLGDVSGKGLAAAIYAAMTRYMTHAYALEANSPAEVLHRVNSALCAEIDDPSIFVTALYAVLNPEAKTLCYSNAGHWPALLARQQSREVVGGHGLALGISPEASYEQGHLHLAPGDEFLVFTDGLVETGGGDPMDQLELVQERMGRWRDNPPQRLVARLHQDALRRGGGALRDDVALLALRCDEPSRPRHPESRSRVNGRENR